MEEAVYLGARTVAVEWEWQQNLQPLSKGVIAKKKQK